MADSAIENARSLQADLEARIRKLQHDINLLRAQKENVDQFIAQWKRFAGQDYSADVAVSNSSVSGDGTEDGKADKKPDPAHTTRPSYAHYQ